jgi:hypothetical protein
MKGSSARRCRFSLGLSKLGLAFRGVPRLQCHQALQARRHSSAGTGGPVWPRVRPERWIGRDSRMLRLMMKWLH